MEIEQEAPTIYSTDLNQKEFETLRAGEELENNSDQDAEDTKEPVADEAKTDQDSGADEESEDVEESDSDSEEDEDSEKSEDEKPKKRSGKSGFEKRRARYNRRLAEKDQEIEQLRRELLSKGQPSDEPEQEAKPKGDEKPVRPNEDDFVTYEEFVNAKDQYFEDLADWKADQKVKAALDERDSKTKAAKEKTEYQKRVETHSQRVDDFKKENPDFDEVLQDAIDSGVEITPAFETLILDSEVSAEITYHLASDLDEFERFNKMDPLKMAKEIGKLELKFQAGPSSEQTEVKKSKAPKPLATKVGTKGKGAVKSIHDPKSFNSFKEWEEARNAQLRKRR